MLLEPGKAIPKRVPAAPAQKVAPQVALAAWVAADVVLIEGEVVERDEEGGREAVVVFTVATRWRMAEIDGDEVQVKVVHGGVGVDADLEGGGPVAAWWDGRVRWRGVRGGGEFWWRGGGG